MENYLKVSGTAGFITGLSSLLASLLAGLACIGPLAGIALGVSGLGWLSQYTYLTVPASILSIALLFVAVLMYVRRKQSCINRTRHRINKAFLFITAVIVIGINVFEFVILPKLL